MEQAAEGWHTTPDHSIFPYRIIISRKWPLLDRHLQLAWTWVVAIVDPIATLFGLFGPLGYSLKVSIIKSTLGLTHSIVIILLIYLFAGVVHGTSITKGCLEEQRRLLLSTLPCFHTTSTIFA